VNDVTGSACSGGPPGNAGIDLDLVANEQQECVLVQLQELKRCRQRHGKAVVSAHAIDCDMNWHTLRDLPYLGLGGASARILA
jgi:hypothetical protein